MFGIISRLRARLGLVSQSSEVEQEKIDIEVSAGDFARIMQPRIKRFADDWVEENLEEAPDAMAFVSEDQTEEGELPYFLVLKHLTQFETESGSERRFSIPADIQNQFNLSTDETLTFGFRMRSTEEDIEWTGSFEQEMYPDGRVRVPVKDGELKEDWESGQYMSIDLYRIEHRVSKDFSEINDGPKL